MRTKCIGVRSVTYAQKAQDVLKRYGIKAGATKRSSETTAGCGWCVKVPYAQFETAYTLLKNNGVKVTGEIYDIS
ncbi:MAG: DUF3343 domain-containing protein [Clostridia bacterium]|nr:DUF3343 domain-containing protein [Clostridia bacterium]